MIRLKTNTKPDYKKHLSLADMIQLVQHLERDGEHGYSFMLMIGSFLGYKMGTILDSKWSDYISEDFKCRETIRLDSTEERPIVKFLKSFIELIYREDKNPDLNTNPFNTKSGAKINSTNVNKKLRLVQEAYSEVIGMPYLLESDTMRRVCGLHVWEKSNYQNSALTVLRKHFKHNSDKTTREFLMIPQKKTSHLVTGIYELYDPPFVFQDILLE